MPRESPGEFSFYEEQLYTVLGVDHSEQERFIFAEFVEWCAYARLAFDNATKVSYAPTIHTPRWAKPSNVAADADSMLSEYVKRRDAMLAKLVELRKAGKP